LLGCSRAERSIASGWRLVEGGGGVCVLGGYRKQEMHLLKCWSAKAVPGREPPIGAGKLEVECHWVSRAVLPATASRKQTKKPRHTQKKQEKPLFPTVSL